MIDVHPYILTMTASKMFESDGQTFWLSENKISFTAKYYIVGAILMLDIGFKTEEDKVQYQLVCT